MQATRAPGRRTPAPAVVLVGCRGGAGTSTLAALVSERLARSGPTALVDLDLTGGGVEVVLGVEDVPGARWADLTRVRGAVAPASLEGVLPRWGRVEVLGPDRRGAGGGGARADDGDAGARVNAGADAAARAGGGHGAGAGPAAGAGPGLGAGAGPAVGAGPGVGAGAEAVRALVGALAEGERALVLDVPAAALLDHGLRDVLGAVGAATVLLVTTQDVLGVAAALTVRQALPVAAHGVVLRRRRRARVVPAEAAHVLGLPLLGVLTDDAGLRGGVERGLGPVVGRFSRVARVAEAVARSTSVEAGGTGRRGRGPDAWGRRG